MKTKNRRIFYGVLIALLSLIVILGGCAGGGDRESESGEPPEQEEESASDSETPVPSAEELIAKGLGSSEGYSYDYVVTMPDGSTLAHKMWVKEKKMRSEMENPQGGDPILSIVDLDKQIVYMMQPQMNQAIALSLENSDTEYTSPKDYLADADDQNMIFVRKDDFEGKKCLVYEMPVEGGKGEMWIWEEGSMPLKVVTTVDGETVTAEFRNFTMGNLEDSLFEIPAGVQVMDMDEMMKSFTP